MEAILYICHGSRVKQAQEQAKVFIQTCISENPVSIQEYGFLELSAPTIEEAFKNCIERGATKIIAIPVLLLTAAHAKEDIPYELSRLKKLFPDIKLMFGEPIGVHPDIIEILMERIIETRQGVTDESMVLLVGRGSSDPEVKVDLMCIAEMLKKRLGIGRVDICFLAAASPNLEEGYNIVQSSQYKKVFVIPYLLFTGVLMKKLEKMIKTNNQNLSQQVILCNYLGYHPLLKKILRERVMEAK